MGLSFRKKSAKNYVQFTTRYEEDLMIKRIKIKSQKL